MTTLTWNRLKVGAWACGLVAGMSGLAVVLGGCASPRGGKTTSGEFRVRPYTTRTLANGLKVTVVEDSSLPILGLRVLVRGGASLDPDGFEGLSSAVGHLLDKGTKKRSEEQLSEELADYAASFSASVNEDFTLASISSLSFHRDRMLADFFEIVTTPTFPQVELARYQKRLLASLKSTVDEPREVVELAFSKFLFGDHPYARSVSGTLKSVPRLSRSDVVKQYQKTFQPTNAHLLVVGQLTPDFIDEVERLFGGWQGQPVMERQARAPKPIDKTQILFVDKEGLKQSQIRLGHIGIKRNDPDFIPLRVAATILGGGFYSRLMQEIRVKRGLTYSIYSSFAPALDPGGFEVSTFSRNDKVGETIKESLRVLKELREKGVTETEVRDAVSYLKGQFPQALETADAFGTQLLYLNFYGVPDTYFETYLRDLEQLTAKDINRVIAKHLRPDTMRIVVHATASEVQDQVKEFGDLQVVNAMSVIER